MQPFNKKMINPWSCWNFHSFIIVIRYLNFHKNLYSVFTVNVLYKERGFTCIYLQIFLLVGPGCCLLEKCGMYKNRLDVLSGGHQKQLSHGYIVHLTDSNYHWQKQFPLFFLPWIMEKHIQSCILFDYLNFTHSVRQVEIFFQFFFFNQLTLCKVIMLIK